MVHVFIFVKWEDDWNWEQFRIFQASWVLQWNRVLVLQQRTRTVQLEWKRDAWGTETLAKVCGETTGHRDGVQSRWNMTTASYFMLYTLYRNTVFVCDTGNKAVRMLTSAKGLIPLQSKMAQYANVFRLDKKAKEEDPPRTFEDHVNSAEELVAFLSNHEQARKPWRRRASAITTVPTLPYLDAPDIPSS